MKKIIYEGNLHSDFEGFHEDALFKMSDGTYWVQTNNKYWDHYASKPKASITQEGERYWLHVAGKSVEVKRPETVIESSIEGAFEGWKGETAYKLTNGQVWKQKDYKYEYRYAYNPDIVVAKFNGSYAMYVGGLCTEVIQVHDTPAKDF